MSSKIRISFEHPHELEAIVKALKPLIQHYKVQPDKTPFKHAYLTLKEISRNAN